MFPPRQVEKFKLQKKLSDYYFFFLRCGVHVVEAHDHALIRTYRRAFGRRLRRYADDVQIYVPRLPPTQPNRGGGIIDHREISFFFHIVLRQGGNKQKMIIKK